MIKYKVSFEITNTIGDFIITDKNLDKELYEKKLKEYQDNYKVYVKEMVFEGIENQQKAENRNKVTDFKIEEVEEND